MLTHKDLNLGEFKTLLEAEKKKIKQSIEMLAIEADTLVRDDEVGNLTDATEIQIDSMTDRVILSQLRAELLEIDAALGRIESGSYGVCETTGKPIPTERLIANPMARTVINI